jgi:hypothetical protein
LSTGWFNIRLRNDHGCVSGNFVMPGLEPGIHVFVPTRKKDVDGRAFASPKRLRPRRRDKPGHDEIQTEKLTPA